ncbi:fMet-Leu-Phe receptor [Biomphalaria glabrata]|nr:fMet-Leu-Phe receptor-like [Biomphalaria glabrata]
MEISDDSENVTFLIEPAQKVITDSQFIIFTEIFSIVCSSASLLGSFGNLLVIKTFKYMGLKDGVTLSFVFLAASDLTYLLTMAVQGAALGLHGIEKKNEFKVFYSVDPFGIYIFLANLGILIYLVTMSITTFLAIARCLCVAMPIKFKNWFRRKTSVVMFVVFCIVSIVSYAPILMFMKMVKAYDARVNTTRYILWISPKREKIKQAVWISRDVFVTFLTQLIVVACVIILTRSLRAAAKFRHTTTAYSLPNSLATQAAIFTTHAKENNGESGLIESHLNSRSDILTARDTRHQCEKLSPKDISVVQQVVLISTVYIVCNMPKICIDVTGMFVPEFTLGKSYQNLYLAFICVMELFQLFNSSIGILIYYNYNTKFRKNCSLFL